MISPKNLPLKPFNETECLRFLAEAELIVDAQINIPWDTKEKQRTINLSNMPDVRYFNRLRQLYEGAGWIVSDLYLNINTEGYMFIVTRS